MPNIFSCRHDSIITVKMSIHIHHSNYYYCSCVFLFSSPKLPDAGVLTGTMWSCWEQRCTFMAFLFVCLLQRSVIQLRPIVTLITGSWHVYGNLQVYMARNEFLYADALNSFLYSRFYTVVSLRWNGLLRFINRLNTCIWNKMISEIFLRAP